MSARPTLTAPAIELTRDVTTLVGDCLVTLPTVPARSVHTIVTSPPYLDARDYEVPPTDWPEVTYRPRFDLEPVTVPAMTCCLGHEATLVAYVGHLVLVARELARVLRDDGTFWLNLAAGYSSGTTAPRKPTTTEGDRVPASWKGRCHSARVTGGLAAKQRIPVPSAACDALQADGWLVRADIVWSKPNAKPDSALDRPTPAHEHLYLLTRSPHYYFDAAAISTPAKHAKSRNRGRKYGPDRGAPASHQGASIPWEGDTAHPRDVWTINVGRFQGAHFATMPVELALRALKAGTSGVGCCPSCGAPWRRMFARDGKLEGGGRAKNSAPRVFVGWSMSCACPLARPTPCTALDPFGGAATTAVAARELDLRTVLCELSPAFVEMQRDRLADEARRRAPRRAPAPVPTAPSPVGEDLQLALGGVR